jgi:DNA-binding MarR family transcriptional regulator/N-acetylglutamate synthase-like GNAT family acetyltransferase
MDLIQTLGELAFASRLRRLSERLMRDVARVYADARLEFEPRWFPVLFLLRGSGPMAVTEMAVTLGVTHPAVNQIAASMERKGLLTSSRDRKDDRRRLLRLTAKGRALGRRLEPVWAEIESATREMLAVEAPGLLQTLGRVERSLDQRSIADRIRAARLARELVRVEIAPYARSLKGAFAKLNREWLEEYFEVEVVDEQVLADPEGTILRDGGRILFALLDGRPIGTVALIRRGPSTFELAKMAVTAQSRGGGVGRRLAIAAIAEARAAGALTLILQTSRKLVAASRLYASLGFTRVPSPSGAPSHYRRPTYTMKLDLRDADSAPANRRKR